MKTTHKRVLALMSVGALGIVGVAWAQSSVRLVINGNPVTTNVRTIGGQKYVPVSAVAKALKMNVYTSGNQITLRPAGGAYQIANKLVGKQGEDLFSGRWGFKVLSVERAQSYNWKFFSRYTPKRPLEAEANEELIAITCRLKNGTKIKDNFAFSTGDWAENTALTDMSEQAFQPYAYDVAADESAPLGKIAMPGGSINFAVIFRVPQGTQLKDLVYTVVRYKERGDKKGTDFRVSLQQ